MKALSVGGGWSGVVTGYPLVIIKTEMSEYICSTEKC